ncbi:MAG: hypothetical protein WCK55_02915 [Verrucomicrobiota bacterium]
MAFQANLVELAEVVKEMNEIKKLTDIFGEDRMRLSTNLEQDLVHQYFRRMLIRLESARIDGLTNRIRKVALAADLYSKKKFSAEEIKLLSKPARGPPIERIKSSWRFFYRALEGSEYELPEEKEWEQLGTAIKIRNRLVHPEMATELTVTDDELCDFLKGVKWFFEKLSEYENRFFEQLRRVMREKKIYRRDTPKLSRNEICPRGCGRKVKNCCCKAAD